MSERLSWGLSLSHHALPLLRQLLERGLIDRIASPADGVAWQGGDLQGFLASEWPRSRAFVAIGACGAITRLIAPLLEGKQHDPAVVVADPQGRFAIPLLGGHGAGAEALAQAVAALLGGEAVLTGTSAAHGQLALDAFGTRWGWRRGAGDWDALMKAAARGEAVQLEHQSGNPRWLQLPGLPERSASGIRLSVGVERSDHCRWHPPALWVGMGCERGTSLSLLQRCLRCFSSAALNAVPVPNPSAVVEAELGTASVAEAAALLAAGPQATLRTQKRIERARDGEQGAATAAIAQAAAQWAPQRGCLHLIGSGPGSLALLTPDARAALAASSVWVGYGLYLDLLEPLRRPDQLRSDGQLTQERERCREALELACQGLTVALVSSGDSGIYGMAGLALEQWMGLEEQDRPAFQVHPGISALQLAAARAGAPLMHDFCTVSLSDRLTPWEVIERRLQGAAAGDFVVALYNPRSKGRDWQLGRAQELLLEHRPPHTPVVLARQLGRGEETVSLHELATLPIHQVDMLTLVLIGNSSSRVEGGRMVTPRGYPGAELS